MLVENSRETNGLDPLQMMGFQARNLLGAVCSIFRWTSHVRFHIFPWKLVIFFCLFCYFASKSWCLPAGGTTGMLQMGGWTHRNSLILNWQALEPLMPPPLSRNFFQHMGMPEGRFQGMRMDCHHVPSWIATNKHATWHAENIASWLQLHSFFNSWDRFTKLGLTHVYCILYRSRNK